MICICIYYFIYSTYFIYKPKYTYVHIYSHSQWVLKYLADAMGFQVDNDYFYGRKQPSPMLLMMVMNNCYATRLRMICGYRNVQAGVHLDPRKRWTHAGARIFGYFTTLPWLFKMYIKMLEMLTNNRYQHMDGKPRYYVPAWFHEAVDRCEFHRQRVFWMSGEPVGAKREYMVWIVCAPGDVPHAAYDTNAGYSW